VTGRTNSRSQSGQAGASTGSTPRHCLPPAASCRRGLSPLAPSARRASQVHWGHFVIGRARASPRRRPMAFTKERPASIDAVRIRGLKARVMGGHGHCQDAGDRPRVGLQIVGRWQPKHGSIMISEETKIGRVMLLQRGKTSPRFAFRTRLPPVRPRSKAPAPHPARTRGTCDERTDFAPFTFDRLFSAVVRRDGARKTAVGRSRRFTREWWPSSRTRAWSRGAKCASIPPWWRPKFIIRPTPACWATLRRDWSAAHPTKYGVAELQQSMIFRMRLVVGLTKMP
jgi:hypothetical protein